MYRRTGIATLHLPSGSDISSVLHFEILGAAHGQKELQPHAGRVEFSLNGVELQLYDPQCAQHSTYEARLMLYYVRMRNDNDMNLLTCGP